jgi:Transglycosylase
VGASVVNTTGLRSFNELLQSPRALKALVAGGGVLSLLLIGLLATPALVRGKVERAARERGLEAQVDTVSLGLGKLWLRDVRVLSPGDDFELRLDTVSVGIISGSVRASGGELRGRGDPKRLIEKLRGRPARKAGGSGSDRELSLQGLFARWEQEGRVVEVFGARAARAGTDLSFGADLARLKTERLRLSARGVALGLATKDGRRQLVRLQTSAIELMVAGEAAPLLVPAAKQGKGPRPPPLEAEGPSMAARLRGLRELLLPLLREGLADGAHLTLDGVSAQIGRAGETLSFGPSRALLSREGELLRVSLSPSSAEAGVTPLALSLSLPLAPAAMHVIAKGGPVSLSSLGVRSGQLGLGDVRRATLAADGSATFSEDFETVDLDGRLSIAGLTLQRRELSPQPVGPWGFEGALKGRARLDGSELTVTSSEAHLGEVRAELSGRVRKSAGQRHVEGRLRLPLSACQSLLDAVPNGLLPLVEGMKLGGSFGIDLQVRYDESAPKETQVVLAVKNECRIREVPLALSPSRFERPFMREVKAPDGSPTMLESGPGTPSWVSLDDVSRHMESAVLVCEDSRFHAHGGFDFKALENAIKDDLKVGRFARGASTISMQLAKNLYLGREKTLGRKLQEALLTMLLEQQLDKRRILELYLNVVELGPGLYGVRDAAEYYFATPARALTLGQSLYLASILPNPTFSRFGADGKLNPQWQSYLRRLMHIAHKIKRVDDAELEAGLAEEIAFRVPGTPTLLPSDEPPPFDEPPAPSELGGDGDPP